MAEAEPSLRPRPLTLRPLVDTYNLFLGNEVYLPACPDHCDPAAVWPVNQN